VPLIDRQNTSDPQAFVALGDRYINAADNDVSYLARALFVPYQPFFTFVHEDGVEPTEDAAKSRPLQGRAHNLRHCSLGRVAEGSVDLLESSEGF
jgi:hypothetical protein